MGDSLRERILNSKDVKEKIITVKQWNNEKILIKGITVKSRYAIFVNENGETNKDIARSSCLTVAECSFDPKTGEKIFLPEDVNLLMEKNPDAVEYISSEILALSGMTKKAEEDIEKNSDSGTPQE